MTITNILLILVVLAIAAFAVYYVLKKKKNEEVEDTINIDGLEAISTGWLNFEDSIGFISNSMTRLPYEKGVEENYRPIFEALKSFMGLEKYHKDNQKQKGD